MIRELTAAHLDDLASGAQFLATGGGGDPYLPLLLAKQAMSQGNSVKLISCEEIRDDHLVVAVGGVGAPTVSLELLPSIDEAAIAIQHYEKFVGRKVNAVVCFEIGGANSLIPITAAALLGIPIADGDGMGRAFPEAQMTSFSISGVAPTPAVAIDYAGRTREFHNLDITHYEAEIRDFATTAGGVVTVAEHGMSGRQLREVAVRGTLSICLEIGALLRKQRGPVTLLLPRLADLLSTTLYERCKLIFTGKVIQKSTNTADGFDVGECWLEDFNQPDQTLQIIIKNEFLVALRRGEAVASVPDLIVVLEVDTGEPISVERLAFGQRVAVLAIPAPPFFRREPALSITNPQAFGLNVEYRPI